MMLSHSEISEKDLAQAGLERLPVKIGQKYTHYKGGEYEVIALALKEDTLEPLVIYKALGHGGTVWARTYTDWNADIEVNGNIVKRFTKK